MSASATYAAAISTPNGTVCQPKIVAIRVSDPDLRSSFEDNRQSGRPQRPGAGIRSKTSYFRSLGRKTDKDKDKGEGGVGSGVVQERQLGQYPRLEHKPNTGGVEENVYVLTLKVTDSLARPMNEMRERYFPKHLNRTPAHLTLFHALPHSRLEDIQGELSRLAASTRPFHVTTGQPFRMRGGVGVNVDEGYKAMKDVHQQLKSQWLPFLSEQDAGGFRPHWTVMNKVSKQEEVEDALETVRMDLSENMREGRALGLDLWLYDAGQWKWVDEYKFGELNKRASRTTSNRRQGSVASQNDFPGCGEQGSRSESEKRPGMWKRGSMVGEAWRSVSFRRKS